MKGLNKEQVFWEWFEKNNFKFLFLGEEDQTTRDQYLDELLSVLHNYNNNLYFEIGGHEDDQNMEFVITAEGIKEHFPSVEKLVNSAPGIDQWEIIAFKQPQGPDFITEYGGRKFDPKEIEFIPLDNEEDPKAIGIEVFYSDFTEEESDVFIAGTYLMIDSIIGERSTTLDIDYLNVCYTPADIDEIFTMKISELQNFIIKKKGGN